METRKAVLIEARRECYGLDQIGRTMTVGDLIYYLKEELCLDDEQPIYISNDNGYTYGRITEAEIKEVDESYE